MRQLHEKTLPMHLRLMAKRRDLRRATYSQATCTSPSAASPWRLSVLWLLQGLGSCILNGSSTANWGEEKAARKKEVSFNNEIEQAEAREKDCLRRRGSSVGCAWVRPAR